MIVQEGMLAELAFLKGVFAGSPPTWSSFALHVILENQAESATLAYTTVAMWNRAQLATYSSGNPFTNAAAMVGSTATLAGTELTYTNSSGSTQTVYGWSISFYDGTTSRIYNYKRFTSPQSVANGATFKFTPSLTKA